MGFGTRRSRRTRRTRRQFGGSPMSVFDGTSFAGAGGVPIENRATIDPHCGGRRRKSRRGGRRRKSQRGGCGCNSLIHTGGKRRTHTGGNRSFGVDVGSNDMGKMYSGLTVNSCQGGGGAADSSITSTPAGYGMVRPYQSDSSTFMEPVSYNGKGGRRTRHRR